MSRLITFLNEKQFVKEEILDILKRECSDILKFYKNNNNLRLLFRGIKSSDDVLYIKTNKQRKPVDNSKIFHDWLNRGFNSAYGERVRSKCVFCTQKSSIAHLYGNNTYVIFPKGKIHFYYSNIINDIFETIWLISFMENNDLNLLSKNIIAALLIKILTERNIKYNLDLFFNYIPKNILDSIGLIDVSYKNRDKIDFNKNLNRLLKLYPNSSEEFIKYFYKKGNNINDIKNVNISSEIMLICDSYYAIKYDVYTLL